MTESMTEAQAQALFASRFWGRLSARDRAFFQIHEERLCMPFAVFRDALEEALGHPVFDATLVVHLEGLRAELRGGAPAPTSAEILAMIPADVRLAVFPEVPAP